jgi:hypothetical protein
MFFQHSSQVGFLPSLAIKSLVNTKSIPCVFCFMLPKKFPALHPAEVIGRYLYFCERGVKYARGSHIGLHRMQAA